MCCVRKQCPLLHGWQVRAGQVFHTTRSIVCLLCYRCQRYGIAKYYSTVLIKCSIPPGASSAYCAIDVNGMVATYYYYVHCTVHWYSTVLISCLLCYTVDVNGIYSVQFTYMVNRDILITSLNVFTAQNTYKKIIIN